MCTVTLNSQKFKYIFETNWSFASSIVTKTVGAFLENPKKIMDVSDF